MLEYEMTPNKIGFSRGLTASGKNIFDLDRLVKI